MLVDGLVVQESDHDFDRTLFRLDRALLAYGITPLARIDHATAASAAGLALEPLMVLVFGNPKVGTALMQEHASIGIDLPLKILVWQEQGQCRLAYNDPQWLARRHGVEQSPAVIAGMAGLLATLVKIAAGHADML